MGSPRIPDKSGQDLHESGSGREFLPWSFASGSLAGVSPLWFVLTTLAALLAAGVTFSLGCWQLDRAAQKQALFDAVQRQQALAPWDGGELSRGVRQALAAGPLPPDMLAGLLHRPVRLQGHWLPEQTLYLDNRQMNGKAGFFVLTPLRLAAPHDQVVVAVQRGWAPRNFLDRKALPPVQTPASLVQIEGRIEAPPSKLFELGKDKATGAAFQTPGPRPEDPDGRISAIHQNVDFPAWSRASGLPLLSLAVLQTDTAAPGAAGDGLLRDWPVASSGVDKHYGYAFQWFGLCGLIVFLYVWFQIIRRFIRPAR